MKVLFMEVLRFHLWRICVREGLVREGDVSD